MMKKTACALISALIIPTTYADTPLFSFNSGSDFKRFSLSAGWLHAMPQGKANPVNVRTSAKNGTYRVGDVQIDSVTNAIANTPEGDAARKKLDDVVSLGKTLQLIKDDTLTADMSGRAEINSLESWENPNTGLEADNVSTLGIMASYHFTDNVSFQVKAGIPPKVDIKGVGQINAPLVGVATPEGNLDIPIIGGIANGLINGIGDIPLDTQIPITDLSQSETAATARAWLPAFELQYQFGKSGVNKFRPYVGAGVIYAYFNDVELNSGIEQDLVAAGHMIQNVLDDKAGAALDGRTSSADPQVRVKATDTFAPIVTLGATYDFNENWFAVGSVSYAKMNNEAQITVVNSNNGQELVSSSTKIDIDPLISYVGFGYRF